MNAQQWAAMSKDQKAAYRAKYPRPDPNDEVQAMRQRKTDERQAPYKQAIRDFVDRHKPPPETAPQETNPLKDVNKELNCKALRDYLAGK